VLDAGWERESAHFMEKVDNDPWRTAGAAVFRLALDDEGLAPRLLEGLARLRFAVLRAPYAAQGLLVPRRLFEAVSGYRDLAAGEEVDLARRLGRSRIKLLRSRAVSSARSYREEGYLRFILSNQWSVVRHAFSVSPARSQELPNQRTDP
jgi:hypothetical protein